MNQGLVGVAVAVLAGGLGTRIRATLGETPKVLAPINGRAYLDHLLERLAPLGPDRVVLCLGDRAERVIAHVKMSLPKGLTVETVIEDHPLGTAGALRYALPHLTTDPVLIMNGDSWVDTNLGEFVAEHRRRQSQASILCAEVADASRYGRVEVNGRGAVSRFIEKDPTVTGEAFINAGLYLFSKEVLARIKSGAGSSLEYDVLAKLPAGTLHAHVVKDAAFVDIGTPEGLASAATILPKASQTRRAGAA